MTSIAELETYFGKTDETRVVVILAPDTTLTLFLDGSSILESTKHLIVTECCWNV